MSIKHAIAGNFATGSLGRVISALSPILLVPFMIGTWGLEVYGEWLILTAIPAYIMLAPDFGLAGAVVNRMAYLSAEGNEKEAVYIYRSSFLVLIITSAAFVCLGWLIALWVSWSWVGVSTLEHSISVAIIGWSCIQIFIMQQSYLLSGIYRSARRNPRLGLLQSFGQIFYLGISLLALWLDTSPYQYVVVLVIAYALYFVVLFHDSRRIMPNFTLSWDGISLQRVRPYIVPGLGHAGMPLIHALQNQGVLIVLGSLLGPASVGLFQTARVLSNGVKSLLALTAVAIMAELPALLGEGRRALIERLLVRNTQIGVILAICGITTMLFAGESIYRAWLGEQVPYDSDLVILLLVSLLPFAAGQSLAIFLLASNKIHSAILPLILVAIGSIGCVAIGAELASLTGAAVGIIIWELGLTLALSFSISKGDLLSISTYLKAISDVSALRKDIIDSWGLMWQRIRVKP